MKMITIRSIALGVSLSVFSLGAVYAQDISESHEKAARDALIASKATEPFDNIILSVTVGLKNQLTGARPDLAEKISETVDAEALKLASRRGDLEREAARLYAKSFTEEDLKKIAEFYASPTGQKTLKEGPVVRRELGKAAQVWSAGIQRDLQANVNKALVEQSTTKEGEAAGEKKPEDSAAKTEGKKPKEGEVKPEDGEAKPKATE